MKIFTLLVSILLQNSAFATPAEIILIRHGEKPAIGNTLNAKGYQRAQALVAYFQTNPDLNHFGLPVAIYAMAPKQDAQNPAAESGSLRPIETVTPLAEALGLSIHKDYTREEIDPLVNEIRNEPKYDGHMVLICWEHNMIPLIAEALGANSAPKSWQNSAFDRTWILDFTNKLVTSFQNLPQHLLPGDSEI